MKGGWATRVSPTAMRMQREMASRVRALWLTILSRKTLKTGEVKAITMRSPIGMRGIAASTAKSAVDMNKPYRETKPYTSHLLGVSPKETQIVHISMFIQFGLKAVKAVESI